MSHRPKNSPLKKIRANAGSKHTPIVVHSVQWPEPDYKKLARAVVELSKDIQEAKQLGISVDELRRQRWDIADKD